MVLVALVSGGLVDRLAAKPQDLGKVALAPPPDFDLQMDDPSRVRATSRQRLPAETAVGRIPTAALPPSL
jgi:hypothetical protein